MKVGENAQPYHDEQRERHVHQDLPRVETFRRHLWSDRVFANRARWACLAEEHHVRADQQENASRDEEDVSDVKA
jgi:hypothetical protein